MDRETAVFTPLGDVRELEPSKRTSRGTDGGDESYRAILGARAWNRLKPDVRRRFSAKPGRGESIRYAGTMQTVELSAMGWLFAQTCRLIGTPLAPYRGKDIPVSIELIRDDRLHGVAWSRSYAFPNRRLFTVWSTKSRGEENEFIEHIGRGFMMRLKLFEKNGGLMFTSVAYEIAIADKKFRIPSLLTPGITTVTHEQLTGNRFRFTLSVDHPLLGRTIYQDGEFYSVVNER